MRLKQGRDYDVMLRMRIPMLPVGPFDWKDVQIGDYYTVTDGIPARMAQPVVGVLRDLDEFPAHLAAGPGPQKTILAGVLVLTTGVRVLFWVDHALYKQLLQIGHCYALTVERVDGPYGFRKCISEVFNCRST